YARLTGQHRPFKDRMYGEGGALVNVSWYNAVAYAQWLTYVTAKRHRLPTEEEWIYAATSGGKDELPDETDQIPYFTDKPNGFGLFGMIHGGIQQWLQDCAQDVDEDKCSSRLIRVGYTNVAYTGRPDDPGLLGFVLGFRLAQDLP